MSPFKSLRVRASQGTQYITDLRKAVPRGFRGRPVISDALCPDGCQACKDVCPTVAVALNPVSIDLGRCVFCNACAEACPEGKIVFTSDPKMGATERAGLIVRQTGQAGAGESEQSSRAGSTGARALSRAPGSARSTPDGESERSSARSTAEEALRLRASEAFAKLFGRSLKMRQVSAGGCNACELELNALANVNFDVQRFGIEWVASPRHADALVLTGPLTRTMKDAVRLAWEAMPSPRFLVAVGACTISGGLYDGAAGVDRSFLESVGPSLFVPGCPPHPLTFVEAILGLLDVR